LVEVAPMGTRVRMLLLFFLLVFLLRKCGKLRCDQQRDEEF
jgi:hypothetical protein